jgi:hypothetical protein
MSLKFFHIFFISLSVILSLGVGLWALNAFQADRDARWLALVFLAFAGGGGLVVYGNRFLHKIRKLGLVAFVVATLFGGRSDVLACTVCVGNTDSSLVSGMSAGILVLLGITAVMLVCFAAFFIYLARRARRAERMVESHA